MTSPEALFDAVLAGAPAQPCVTYYDEATGERAELSAKSLANWVAKTHFLLMDGLGLGVGDAAFVDLPAHWICVPALLGCWTAGLTVTSEPGSASVAFVAPATLARAAGVPDVYAIAPDSPATGFRSAPPHGADDYVAAVRPQPDKWPTVHMPASPADPAIDAMPRAEVAAAAARRAAELGLEPSARLLTSREWHGPDDWIDTLLAPLSVGGSLVLVRHGDPAQLARRAEQERATNVL